jgi:hypothetical protein
VTSHKGNYPNDVAIYRRGYTSLTGSEQGQDYFGRTKASFSHTSHSPGKVKAKSRIANAPFSRTRLRTSNPHRVSGLRIIEWQLHRHRHRRMVSHVLLHLHWPLYSYVHSHLGLEDGWSQEHQYYKPSSCLGGLREIRSCPCYTFGHFSQHST